MDKYRITHTYHRLGGLGRGSLNTTAGHRETLRRIVIKYHHLCCPHLAGQSYNRLHAHITAKYRRHTHTAISAAVRYPPCKHQRSLHSTYKGGGFPGPVQPQLDYHHTCRIQGEREPHFMAHVWLTNGGSGPAYSACPSHPIPSHSIPSHPIPSHPIPSHPIPSHPIPSHPIHHLWWSAPSHASGLVSNPNCRSFHCHHGEAASEADWGEGEHSNTALAPRSPKPHLAHIYPP